MSKVHAGSMAIAEMKEFGSFTASTQRYIRRSLDVAANDENVLGRWSRDVAETATIRAQSRVYDRIDEIRDSIPDEPGLTGVERLMAPLVFVTAFDLGQGRLETFSAYRFLYERLVGATVRPWLPSAFCAAAALPTIHPESRRKLLQSISEAAATASGWSARDPKFIPTWVEKIEVPKAA